MLHSYTRHELHASDAVRALRIRQEHGLGRGASQVVNQIRQCGSGFEQEKRCGIFLSYLKIDKQTSSPLGGVLWVPVIEDATPFETEADAKAVQGQIAEVTGVLRGVNGYFYVYIVKGNLT